MSNIHFSAHHIAYRKNQDRASYSETSLLVCDGIGSHKQSVVYAEALTSVFYDAPGTGLAKLAGLAAVDNKDIVGGTTAILASLEEGNWISFQYLGNGGIIHLAGNYAEGGSSVTHPFRYAELMLPHTNAERSLVRHYSSDSGPSDLIPGELKVKLNHPYGDIILVFSDGISALEEKVIVDDGTGRFFRLESDILQFILKELDQFLKQAVIRDLNDQLAVFCKTLLTKLKTGTEQNDVPEMDDDVALGIIISSKALEHYRQRQST